MRSEIRRLPAAREHQRPEAGVKGHVLRFAALQRKQIGLILVGQAVIYLAVHHEGILSVNPLEGAEGMRAVEHIELSIPEADLHLVGQARVEAVHDAIHPGGIDLALVAEIRFQPRGGHPLVFVAALVVAGNAVADGHGLRGSGLVRLLNRPFNGRGREKIPAVGLGGIVSALSVFVLSAHAHFPSMRSFRIVSTCALVRRTISRIWALCSSLPMPLE